MFAKILYRPTRRLSFTVRHIIFSGSFFDAGVKKLTTALSVSCVSRAEIRAVSRLTCCMRLLPSFRWRWRNLLVTGICSLSDTRPLGHFYRSGLFRMLKYVVRIESDVVELKLVDKDRAVVR